MLLISELIALLSSNAFQIWSSLITFVFLKQLNVDAKEVPSFNVKDAPWFFAFYVNKHCYFGILTIYDFVAKLQSKFLNAPK